MSSVNNNMMSRNKMALAEPCEESVNNSGRKGVNKIGGSVRKTSCHQLSFIKLFQIVCVLFLVVHVFIQPASAIRLQVHKAKSEKRGGNFGWDLGSRDLQDYSQFDQGVRHSSVFDAISPYSVWNLDNSRAAAAVPEYETVDPQDTQDQGAIDPSVALYLTENLLAKYVARQDKLQQQRKQAALMDEVFGLH